MDLSVKCLLFVFIVLTQACARPVVTQTPASFTVNVEGQAAITHNSKLLARKQALQDAVRHAALQSGVMVKGQTSLSHGGVLFDTFTLRTAAAVNFSKITDEWEENNIYHVRAWVTLSGSDFCTPQYRKRIVATGFPLAQPEQLSGTESQDISSGIPREIMHLLMESRDFIGVNHTHISLYPQADVASTLDGHQPYTVSSAMQMASQDGGQLVLSGVIRDLKIELANDVQGYGLLAMAKSMARNMWAKRSIGLDIYVHDGFTGALLTQYRYTDEAGGDVWVPANVTVGSEGFRDTAVGAKLSKIIASASVDLRKALSCYPFTTRIIQIDGDKVFIDAGAQENINMGDQFVVYADTSEELHLEGFRQYAGRDKQPVAVLTIRDIKPRYAIGELDVPPKGLGVQEGDWVRSW